MKFQIVLMLLTALLALFVPHTQSRPTNSMTRIQELFRTLNGPKPLVSQRGKKSVLMTRPSESEDYRLVYLTDPSDLLFEDN